MHARLLEFLRCPDCQGSFSIHDVEVGDGEIERGVLGCPRGHRFPVVAGIPRILEDAGDERERERGVRRVRESQPGVGPPPPNA